MIATVTWNDAHHGVQRTSILHNSRHQQLKVSRQGFMKNKKKLTPKSVKKHSFNKKLYIPSKLTKDFTFVAIRDHFQIWRSPVRWITFRSKKKKKFWILFSLSAVTRAQKVVKKSEISADLNQKVVKKSEISADLNRYNITHIFSVKWIFLFSMAHIQLLFHNSKSSPSDILGTHNDVYKKSSFLAVTANKTSRYFIWQKQNKLLLQNILENWSLVMHFLNYL